MLRQVILANETKVSFQFGRYVQDSGQLRPGSRPNRFLYTDLRTTRVQHRRRPRATPRRQLPQHGGLTAPPEADCGRCLRSRRPSRLPRRGSCQNGLSPVHQQVLQRRADHVRQNGASPRPPPPPASSPTRATSAPPRFRPTAPALGRGPEPVRGRHAPGSLVRFRFQGIRWAKGNNTATSCGGFENLVGLAPCTQNVQINAIGPHLQPELSCRRPATSWATPTRPSARSDRRPAAAAPRDPRLRPDPHRGVAHRPQDTCSRPSGRRSWPSRRNPEAPHVRHHRDGR